MKKIIFASILISIVSVAQAKQNLEEVVVEAHLLSEGGLSQSYDVLSGEDLQEELQTSLGETVANMVGVRNASFGAASGRPVVHGLGGPRVKTTEDRIDTLDVSVTSTDHAVTVEPFIADQITILKGASTLLYGSAAIGGVVDTQTGRIPFDVEEPFTGRVQLRGADNGDALSGAIRLDGRVNDSFSWHVDAFAKDADDYEINGYAESLAQRESEEEEHGHDEHHDEDEEHHDEDEEHHDEEEHHEDEHGHSDEEGEEGILEGSRYDTKGAAVGFAWKTEKASFGFSVSRLDSEYGLVGHSHAHEHGEDEHDDEHEEEHGDEHEEEGLDEDEHEHEEGEEEEGIGMLDLEQTRIDFEGEWISSSDWLDKINVRIGINDYEHIEIEGNGEVGTLFDNEAWEGRLEFSHAPIAGFDGVFGLQLSSRDFSAIGEEAFVQPVDSDTTGLFWVGEKQFGDLFLEAGIRFETVDYEPSLDFSDEDFSTTSASLGFVFDQNQSTTWTALLDYTERAPSIEELFSNGPHLATETFEIGDPSLGTESAIGLTLGWSYTSDLFDAKVSIYHNRFDDFIFQANTGEIEDDLPVLVYQQQDADFTGADIELAFHVTEIASGDFDITFKYDLLEAECDSGVDRDIPRLPADKFSAGLLWKNDNWRAKLNYSHVSAQSDVAAFESPTESYDDVDLSITRYFKWEDKTLSVFINGRNLTDEEQREHVSFIKDLAPLPGRTIEAGLRLDF